MNLNKNYYLILGVSKDSTLKEVKKEYYNKSKIFHPDKNNKESDPKIFTDLTEAYDVLCGEKRADYDLKSRFGNNYNEYFELFEIKVDLDYDIEKERFETFKKNDIYNIQIKVDDTFDGTLEYERWVKCKTCDGSGKDLSSKIVIRDIDGNVTKTFDADDGCDFCFEENNHVITKRGPVKISEVVIGDLALSKDNEYYPVTHLMNRDYSGDVYDVNVCGIKIEGVTPNHKLNVVRFSRNNKGSININNYNIIELPVEDLTIDDFVLYQKQTYTPCESVLLNNIINRSGYKKGNLRTYTTVYEKLAKQVLHISLGLGHNSYISKYNGYVDKKGVNHRDCYRVYIKHSDDLKKMGLYNKSIKEGTCLKVKSINIRNVSNIKVYNITVNDTHKYTIDGLLVNNCEGTGKDYKEDDCHFCSGKGKIGLTPCKTCKGEKRILGKQKLKSIKLTGKETKLEAMGHFAKNEPGKVGYLLLLREKE